RALASDIDLSYGYRGELVFDRYAFAENVLRHKDQRRVVPFDGCPQQSGSIFRRAWDDDVQAVNVRPYAFVTLAMPEAASREISAARGDEDQRTGPFPERPPAQG